MIKIYPYPVCNFPLFVFFVTSALGTHIDSQPGNQRYFWYFALSPKPKMIGRLNALWVPQIRWPPACPPQQWERLWPSGCWYWLRGRPWG